mgnify:CR=1 FL=1
MSDKNSWESASESIGSLITGVLGGIILVLVGLPLLLFGLITLFG